MTEDEPYLITLARSAGLICQSNPQQLPASDASHLLKVEETLKTIGFAVDKVHSTELGSVDLGKHRYDPASLIEIARQAPEREPVWPYAHVDRSTLLRTLDERREVIDSRSDSPALLQGLPVLSNLMMSGPQPCGFADWQEVRVGDRHWDLAITCRDLVRLIGPNSVSVFIDSYGHEAIDPVRLDWYSLFVELAG